MFVRLPMGTFVSFMSILALLSCGVDVQNSSNPNANTPLNHVFAFEHAGYAGKMYNLSTEKMAHWNDRISSLRVPDGYKITLCQHHRLQGHCQSFFDDIPYVGHTLNDEISSFKIERFNAQDFSMIVTADPQLNRQCRGACLKELGGSPSAKSMGKLSNTWQTQSISRLSREIGYASLGGLIINGDLTEFGHGHELADFRDFYDHQGSGKIKDADNLPINVWLGLGNHDYANNVDDCAENGCAVKMVHFMRDKINGYDTVSRDYKSSDWGGIDVEGSLAYSWDIGRIHFIQLHNYPTYERSFKGRKWHGPIPRSENIKIKNSLKWLAKDLKSAADRGMHIILNWHDYLEHSDAMDVYAVVKPFENNIRGIFVGHFHGVLGLNTYMNNIPVFYSGSAEYGTYLKVRFKSGEMSVQKYSSDHGKATPVGAAVKLSLPDLGKIFQPHRRKATLGAMVSLNKGYNLSGESLCTIPLPRKRVDFKAGQFGCKNDSARSLVLYRVKAGTHLTFYDSPGGSKEVDFVQIHVKRDLERYVIRNFETSYADDILTVSYFHNNGLNGKVSLMDQSSGRPPAQLILKEGNHGTQNIVCTIPLEGSRSENLKKDRFGCDNDEARSAIISNALAGTEIAIFDDPKGRTKDDYQIIRIKKNLARAVIPSFHDSFETSSLSVKYYRKNGLDGKVSHVRVRR